MKSLSSVFSELFTGKTMVKFLKPIVLNEYKRLCEDIKRSTTKKPKYGIFIISREDEMIILNVYICFEGSEQLQHVVSLDFMRLFNNYKNNTDNVLIKELINANYSLIEKFFNEIEKYTIKTDGKDVQITAKISKK